MSHLEAESTDSPPLFSAALQEPSLPSYSQSSPSRPATSQVEHTYSLNSSKGVPWLTLKLKSYASSAQSLPVYYGDNLGVIEGILSINSSELGKIKSATAVVSSQALNIWYPKTNWVVAVRGANSSRTGPESKLSNDEKRALECLYGHVKRALAY